MTPLRFIILGIPHAKQSARFMTFNKGTQTIIRAYQAKRTVQYETNIAYQVKEQLPKGFCPLYGPIKVKALFVFPPTQKFTKKMLKDITEGKIYYKSTKPDLTDNLMKGTIDALNGIVFKDDAIIAEVHSKKIYGIEPRIELEFDNIKNPP